MGIEARRAYIEVGSQANSLTATLPDGTTENLYELLLPQDSNLGFKALGIPDATALPLSKYPNIGSMSAIVKLNNIQIRIWGKAQEQLHFSLLHNEDGFNIINLIMNPQGNYQRLSKTPGILISPIFNYSDVASGYDTIDFKGYIEQISKTVSHE